MCCASTTGRYWSYLCHEPVLLPAEGVPFDTAGASRRRSAMTAASGQRVLASRDELAATIAPVTGASRRGDAPRDGPGERIAARLIARTASYRRHRPGRSSSTASKPSRPPSPPTGTAAPSS